MKKKIINGILMVAMLFAATTSFVSCKDNVDDELVPIYAQLAQQKTDLQNQINSFQTQIDNLTNQINNQDQKITELKNSLQNQIDLLQGQLNDINQQITTLSADVDQIQNELDELKGDVAELSSAVADLTALVMDLYGKINNLITGIQINQTFSNPVGTINLPGGMLRLNALAAYYGENVLGLREFPTAKFEENHIYGADNMLSTEDVAAAAGQQYTFTEEGYITQPHDNAGMIFFTVNSVDPETFDIDEYTLSAENSLGMTAPITFSDVKPSSYNIQWGMFKSTVGVDTDPDLNGNPTFFQARANIAREDLEISKFNIRKFFNLQEVLDQVKEEIETVRDATSKKQKVTSIANFVAQLLTNIYSGNMSGNDQDIKNPTWSAQKLVLNKEVDGENKKFYADDFDLAVSAVAPLSYNSFWQLESSLEEFKDYKDDIKDIASDIESYVLTGSAAKLAPSFNSVLKNIANAIVGGIKNHALTRAVTPIVLFSTTDGIQLLKSGITVQPGIMPINVTSPTEELLVPAFARYVAVISTDNGRVVQADVVPGGTQLFDLDLTRSGNYKIIVSSVDYYGFIINKRYDVTVE